MAELATKLPAKTESRGIFATGFNPFQALHREIDRLFGEFDGDFWRAPFRGSVFDRLPMTRVETISMPAVDVAEKDNAYEITAELPGIEEKDIDVKLSNGRLTIKGEKKAEKEEKKKDYYLSERTYGSFERSFSVPDGIETDKIAATFKNGVLTITIPKSPEAHKEEKRIAVKAS